MVWDWVERGFSSIGGSIGEGLSGGGSEGWFWWSGGGYGDRWHVGVAVGVTAMAGIALVATIVLSSRRGSLKSPWSRRKRKHILTPQQWENFFTSEGKLYEGGARFLKKVRSGGVDPSIRAQVWPFLLGVYELNSSETERNAQRKQKRIEYKKLRKRCRFLLKFCDDGDKVLKAVDEVGVLVSPCSDHQSLSYDKEDQIARDENNRTHTSITREEKGEISQSVASDDQSDITYSDAVKYENDFAQADQKNNKWVTALNDSKMGESESSDTESSSEESESFSKATIALENMGPDSAQSIEDFTTWQRIIRLDAVRTNAEWVVYAPAQAAVSDRIARQRAAAVGLKDYDHLEPCMIYHAARLVAVLEAYAIYDREIGYCQGMSDLLSPIVAIMEEDDEAFWCFVGFMKKARHNFRLDEVGIRRQLSIVSKIIKFKDPHLYRHLEKLQAEDCFFVYRMVVVLFRRELSFEQTLCLWEVMWADQAAIRAGFGKSAWARIRLRAPPTDDLLLYAIAACVLQRRKLIIERYSSMEEILRECNNMAGQLDVWKLMDDAHDLVVTLHDKIS